MNDYTDDQAAKLLNQAGLLSGKKQPFSSRIVARLRREYHLKSYGDRLREQGFLTTEEIADILSIDLSTVRLRYRKGYLRGKPYDKQGSRLYEYPGSDLPIGVKETGQKRGKIVNFSN